MCGASFPKEVDSRYNNISLSILKSPKNELKGAAANVGGRPFLKEEKDILKLLQSG